MLDAFIERWLGPGLIVIGVLGLLSAGMMALGWFAPTPEPLPPGIAHRIALPPPLAMSRLAVLLGVGSLLVGIKITRHFARERATDRDHPSNVR